mmetsp:Transcript_19300/g.28523  ORF Transcript_19300/g.28523 Transcript_19300/m.28523 type:complete len:213 (+) Transcript_19300:75-713(+)
MSTIENENVSPVGAGKELKHHLLRRATISTPQGFLASTNLKKNEHKPFKFDPSIEFPEISQKEAQIVTEWFEKYDLDKSGTLSLDEMKNMMQQIEFPQNRASLFTMIREIDQDNDGELCLKEFFLIFSKYRKGTLPNNRGLINLVTGFKFDEVKYRAEESKIVEPVSSISAKITNPQSERKLSAPFVSNSSERMSSNEFRARLNMFNHKKAA